MQAEQPADVNLSAVSVSLILASLELIRDADHEHQSHLASSAAPSKCFVSLSLCFCRWTLDASTDKMRTPVFEYRLLAGSTTARFVAPQKWHQPFCVCRLSVYVKVCLSSGQQAERDWEGAQSHKLLHVLTDWRSIVSLEQRRDRRRGLHRRWFTAKWINTIHRSSVVCECMDASLTHPTFWIYYKWFKKKYKEFGILCDLQPMTWHQVFSLTATTTLYDTNKKERETERDNCGGREGGCETERGWQDASRETLWHSERHKDSSRVKVTDMVRIYNLICEPCGDTVAHCLFMSASIMYIK